jgi:hypothetical protein
MLHAGYTDNHSTVQRVCGNCGNSDVFDFTKREIAFNLYSMKKIFDTPCTQCASTENAHLHIKAFTLDNTLLLEWAGNEELHLSHDDELFLGDKEYLEQILDLVDHHEILPIKRHIIFEALCVMIYDQLINDEKPDLALAEHVKAELLKRRDQFLEADRLIMPYIKEVVYPFLGMEFTAP